MPSVNSIIEDFQKKATGTLNQNKIDLVLELAKDKNIRAAVDIYFNDKPQPAIVRIWKDSKAKPDMAEWRDMVVLFPIAPANPQKYYECESVGWDGHGGANPRAVIGVSRKATETEVEIALDNIEEKVGKVYDREQPYFIRAREVILALLDVL